VHSRAFRRLEAKTQVFPQGLSDHFRNRLTHTLEVAQLARTAAKVLGLDEDFTEALALAHDIGHPPFAHSGEEALNEALAPFGLQFEHNLHALQIVERFENRYAMYIGLNLTFEVREGIVKHSRDLPETVEGGLAEYLPGKRPPLEAQLIDWVDEIAYNTADSDDAHDAGFFTLAEFADAIPKAAEYLDEVATQFPAAEERILLHEVLRRLIDHLMRGLMEGTIEACAGLQDVEGVREAPARVARFRADAGETSRAMKKFLHARVYQTEILQEERRRSAREIQKLFAYYLENPQALPAEDGHAARPLPLRVSDYIASMTDTYFRRVYSEVILATSALRTP
jgi:dGTPase